MNADIGGGSVENGTRHSLARISLRWMIRECFKANIGIIFDSAALYIIGLDPNTVYPRVLPRPQHLLERARGGIVEEPETKPWFGWLRNAFTSAAAKKKAAEEKKAAQSAPFVSEEEEELRDALCPVYDQLDLARWWWVLELLPVSMRYQKGNNKFVSYIGCVRFFVIPASLANKTMSPYRINFARPRFIPKQHSSGVKVHRSVQLRMEAQKKNGRKYQPKAHLAVDPTWIDVHANE